jgi:TolA-binding protein
VDCEKFDRIVLDLLYEELDELTSAAAKRHLEHCARCRSIAAGLRATREIGVLSLVDPPEGLEQSIIAAERRFSERLPLGKRVGRALSIMAGYAMRPQLAMAALLLLMIGSGLLFLRAQPGDRSNILVTERGVPESDDDTQSVIAKKAAAPAARAAASHGSPHAEELSARRDRTSAAEARPEPARALAAAPAPSVEATDQGLADKSASDPATGDESIAYDAAVAIYRDGRYSEAEQHFEEIASRGGPHAGPAALFAAQALRMVSGCPAAGPRFEEIQSRYRGSDVSADAAWQAADCYRSLSNTARAREKYQELIGEVRYRARAEAAIAELDQREAESEIVARRAAKARAATPPAAAGAPVPAKPDPKAGARGIE